jgi:CheY-like chemotaxis protein
MSPTPEKPTLIAVDDEKDNLDLVQRTLIGEYSVTCFTNPKQAIEYAAIHRPAVLIVDYRMPEMTGVELLRALRQKGIDVPALMLTGYAELEEVVRARKEGLVSGIVPKPWHADDLKGCLKLTLSVSLLSRPRKGR